MQIANVVMARWLEIHVVNLATHRTVPPARHPRLEHFVRDVDENRDNRVALFCCQLLEACCLCRRARKTVEDVTVATIVLRRSVLNETDRQLIRYELPALHYVSDFLRQRRLRMLERAKDVARRYLRQTETLLKQARLSTLTGTRRAHQYYDLRHTRSVFSSRQQEQVTLFLHLLSASCS